jgi:putative tryptophan/tyrosine transport system substrate-binding protein
MRRREFIAVVSGAAAWPLAARAQQAPMPVIGFLSARSAKDSMVNVAAFGKGLEEAGFVEGKNLSTEYRFADGQLDRLPELAADLVRRPVAVLVTVGGANSALVAKKATSTIPIVFVIGGDPVALGLSSSLSRPDGNATGMTIISVDLTQKRLGLLRELVPSATALAALVNPNTPEGRAQGADMRAAVQSLGLNLRILEAGDEKAIEKAFATLAQDKVDALLVGSDPVFSVHRDKIGRARGGGGTPGDLPASRLCGSRRPDELRSRYRGCPSSGWRLHRQNPQRRKARRPADPAAHNIQFGPQSENSKGAGHHGTAGAAGAR